MNHFEYNAANLRVAIIKAAEILKTHVIAMRKEIKDIHPDFDIDMCTQSLELVIGRHLFGAVDSPSGNIDYIIDLIEEESYGLLTAAEIKKWSAEIKKVDKT